MPGYGQIDHDDGIRLATTPPEADGPVWMVNLMSYRKQAAYADGRDTALTGREADDEYTPLAAVGADIVFVADVEDQFIGDDPTWDRVAVVRYPTRAAFIEMQAREDFQNRRAFLAVASDPDRLRAHAEHRETAIADTDALDVRAGINRLSASVGDG